MHHPLTLTIGNSISAVGSGAQIADGEATGFCFGQGAIHRPQREPTEDFHLVNGLVSTAMAQLMRSVGGQDDQRHARLMRFHNRREEIDGGTA